MKKLLTFLALLTAVSAAPGAEGEARFVSRTRQLIYEGRRSGEGYFSPDGRSIIFQSEREPGNPFYQIYTLDLDSGDLRRVSTGTGKTTCAFFRPGTDEILFASSHLDPDATARQKAEYEQRASGRQRRYAWDYDPTMEIFSARRDGSGLRRLTDAPGYDAEAAYSPDGRQIVFCSLRSAFPTNRLSPEDYKQFEIDPARFGEIYLMNADGSNVRRLTHTMGYDGGPFFSPDGQRILWRRFNEAGTVADVHSMKADGTDVLRLTDFGAVSWAPYFHPSGDYVIFTANKLGFGNFELYLVDAVGRREPVRVTFTDGFDGLPVFSPDGKSLCWTSARTPDGQAQLFMADWNDAEARRALAAAPPRGTVTAPAPATNITAAPPASTTPPAPARAAAITVADLRADVEHLAGEALEGRATGSPGARSAAGFIEQQLRAAGWQPWGTNASMLQPFPFTAGVQIITNDNHLSLTTGGVTRAFSPTNDFRPLSFTANDTVEGEVVFAGYGLVAPGRGAEAYDSYAGLDVSNKIVLVLRYVPEGVDAKRRAELNRYAALRYKAMIAREHGARALLVVTGPNSPNAGELVPLSYDSSLAGSRIVAASVTESVARALLAPSGRDLKSLQSAVDIENPHATANLALPGVRVRLTTHIEQVRRTDQNVIAFLSAPGVPPDGEFVMVGAHYDHLGRGDNSSLQRAGEEGRIHHGADDNASGVAAILELAGALAAGRGEPAGTLRRNVLLALWSGEELGLLGSAHFAEHPLLPLSNCVAYVNFDMVGRLRDNRLILQGIGSSPAWKRLAEKRNVAAGFNLVLQEDPYLPTDVTSFYPRQVPVMTFFTGSHEDYHRPTDTADKLDYAGLERITRFAHRLILDLANEPARPAYAKVERASPGGGGSRDGLRAYLGTIPDYAAEVTGVKLSGVRGGSPADRSGLKGGDVIIELAGQKIANIYDYTYALDSLKIGQAVDVVVVRAGRSEKLRVTPEARK